MKNNSIKRLKNIKMKNKIVKLLENFGYLVAISVGTMLVFWMIKFTYYILTSVYQALIK
jgi:hypothetical protein